ncbi:GreA/GreB family elongation factor [Rubricoccus marinus]|uniref:Transcription elongation factor GreA/GreB C-terminal domain-containing protein n=1 Tax=Rubricoccus marinus TaxID=716817 RepID=A0A259TZ83_9BACT|nr:GreA/GreB family elongation factor [Rubricoccus marinus]OZC03031.1 hypothetical protein BSZ36_08640 [Rubricoccus marinus]
MSRGFKKEEAPEDPIVVPPRAPLPAGVPNYVTPRGEGLLRDELAALDAERSALSSGGGEETQRKREITAVGEKIRLLRQRLAQTQVVDPERQKPGVARFGAHVTLSAADGNTRSVQIVGVDEADAARGLVAFTSPIARAVSGKSVGDAVVLKAGGTEEHLVVMSVAYGEAPEA